jgi:hypothetical protein
MSESTNENERKTAIDKFFQEILKQMSSVSVFAEAQEGIRYKCPCCHYKTLETRGQYDICSVCFWEDDGQDDADAGTNQYFGPNHMSLTQGRENYLRIGAYDEKMLKHVRPPLPNEE